MSTYETYAVYLWIVAIEDIIMSFK